MALANLVRVVSATTGTGTLTLGSPVSGFLTPTQAGMTDGVVYSYAIEADYAASGDDMLPTSREIGTGTLGGTGTTLTRTVINSTNGNTALSLAGDEQVIITGAAHDWLFAITPGAYNANLAESHAASAATFAVKTVAGNDPTAANPVVAIFSDGTKAFLTAALSVTIPSTALMGARNGIPFRLWFCLVNDGGTWRLGVRNCVTTVAGVGSGSTVTLVSGFSDHGTLTSTIMNTSSDFAGVTYTDTAVAADPFVVLGYADYDSGLATAGTWAASPSRIVMYGLGVSLPGQTIQTVVSADGVLASGATAAIPFDNTIPQSGEGTQFQSQAITPNSVQNALFIEIVALLASGGVTSQLTMALFQDAVANALAAVNQFGASPGDTMVIETIRHLMLSATTSATTFKMRAGDAANATITFNGTNATAKFNATGNSSLRITEIMG